MTNAEALRVIAAYHEKQLMKFIAALEAEQKAHTMPRKRVLLAKCYAKTKLTEAERN